jgi:hypothetical protein
MNILLKNIFLMSKNSEKNIAYTYVYSMFVHKFLGKNTFFSHVKREISMLECDYSWVILYLFTQAPKMFCFAETYVQKLTI